MKKIKKILLCMLLVCGVVMFSGCSTGIGYGQDSLDIDYVGEDGEITEEEVSAQDEGLMAWLKNKLSADKKNAGKSGRSEEKSTTEEQESEGVRALYEQAETKNESAQERQEAETNEEDVKDQEAESQKATDSSQSPKTEEETPKQEDEQKTEEKQETTKKNTVTFTIRCDTAVANGMHKEAKWAGIVPASGCILPVITLEFEEGETVFDLLCRVRDTYKLQMEYSGANGGEYIEGINNLYEFDGGRWSGWMYCVNGWYPNYGCGQYVVRSGDVIEWNYTCDLGCDLENGDPYGYGKEWKDTHD